jgi:hypothetical protein
MTKKKEPQMAHANPALDELTKEFDVLIESAAEQVDDEELAERERKADEFIEGVRERASRRERA